MAGRPLNEGGAIAKAVPTDFELALSERSDRPGVSRSTTRSLRTSAIARPAAAVNGVYVQLGLTRPK